MERVAVTGASGHLGSVLTRYLLKSGYAVRAIVRNPRKLAETPWTGGKALDVAVADMRDRDAMSAALAGVDGLFHVAAVFDVTSMSPRSLAAANVGGVESVLQAAARRGVRRVVLTSSAATVGTSSSRRELRDETCWNDRTREAYARSKVLAEHRAWRLARDLRLDLIAVLPGAMLGPGFAQPTPTVRTVADGLRNAFPSVPPIDFAFTDVRDVAQAHVRLYERRAAEGRYLACGPTLSLRQLIEMIHERRASVRTPDEMPPWIARLLPFADAASSLVTGAPRRLRSGFVEEYVGRSHVLSSARLEREVGWSPRPLAETLEDTLSWLEGVRDETILDGRASLGAAPGDLVPTP